MNKNLIDMRFYFFLFNIIITILLFFNACKNEELIIEKNGVNYIFDVYNNDSIIINVFQNKHLNKTIHIGLNRNGMINSYMEYKNKQKTGVYFQKNKESNNFSVIGYYKDNKPYKKWIYFDSNGKLHYMVEYGDTGFPINEYIKFDNNKRIKEYHFIDINGDIVYSRYYKDGSFVRDTGDIYIQTILNQTDYFSFDTIKVTIYIAKPPNIDYYIYLGNNQDNIKMKQKEDFKTEFTCPLGEVTRKSYAWIWPIKMKIDDYDKGDTKIYKDTLYIPIWSLSEDSVKKIYETIFH